MPNQTNLRVAHWNTALTFDPNKDEGHIAAGFRAIEAMDADIIHLPETSSRGDNELMPLPHWEMLQTGMKELGYMQGQAMRGVRPDLAESMWSRVDDSYMSVVNLGGEREIPRLYVPGVGRFFGVHAPSTNESARADVATAFVRHLVESEIDEAEAAGEDIVLIGDLNAAKKTDSATARSLHAANHVVRRLPGVANMEHFSGSRFKRKVVGVITRACAMPTGTSLQIYEDAGLANVAEMSNDRTPTVHEHGLKLRVDHAYVLGNNLRVSDYNVLPRALDDSGKPLSDHNAIAMTVARR